MSKKKHTSKDKQTHEVVVKKHSPHPVMHILMALVYGCLFFFLAINILLSQSIPDRYFSLLKGDAQTIVFFFQRARDIPAFQSLFAENNQLFSFYENEIYADTRHTDELIQKLEAVLAVNPKSRDVLYSLSLLYEKQGDTERASEYLKRARMIDPEIGK